MPPICKATAAQTCASAIMASTHAASPCAVDASACIPQRPIPPPKRQPVTLAAAQFCRGLMIPSCTM